MPTEDYLFLKSVADQRKLLREKRNKLMEEGKDASEIKKEIKVLQEKEMKFLEHVVVK